jgi:hypothetical protein
MPLAYTMGNVRWCVQLGCHHSKETQHRIDQAQNPEPGEVPSFYMASYLLDVVCAWNVFAEMNLSWHVFEFHVHVYFSILWENRYKKSYPMICDLFLSRLYFIIFHQECPRLSKQAKKIISLIGNWYLEEKCTYFRIFGAIGAPHLLPAYVPDILALGEIYVIRLSCKGSMPP